MKSLLLSSLCLLLNSIAANAEPLTILAIGDSLTEGGYNANGWHIGPGYRKDLWLMSPWIGTPFTFVGTVQTNDTSFPSAHEGHSGRRIEEIEKLIQKKVAILNPDVILLMAGTNDIIQNYSLDSIEIRLRALIRTLQKEAPGRPILAGIPIPTSNANFNSRIEKLEKIMMGLRLRTTNLTALNFYRNAKISLQDLGDGVHPTPAGYKKMAEHWAKGLRCVLKNLDCQFL